MMVSFLFYRVSILFFKENILITNRYFKSCNMFFNRYIKNAIKSSIYFTDFIAYECILPVKRKKIKQKK